MFSLIITCPNCTGNVDSLMEAVSLSSLKPDEIIIVTRKKIDIEQCQKRSQTNVQLIRPTEENALSTAVVRNLGASVASTPFLMFMQKDLYPDKDYFEEQLSFVKKNKGVLMGNYDGIKPRQAEVFFSLINDYNNFNGRNFTISKVYFEEIGGFDESYFGQGIEDIDFGYLAKEKNIPIYVHGKFIKDLETEVYGLPLNQFLPIIDNSELFKSKWNLYPMKHCLDSFKNKGLINWNGKDDGEINIIKFPSFEMIEAVKIKKVAVMQN